MANLVNEIRERRWTKSDVIQNTVKSHSWPDKYRSLVSPHLSCRTPWRRRCATGKQEHMTVFLLHPVPLTVMRSQKQTNSGSKFDIKSAWLLKTRLLFLNFGFDLFYVLTGRGRRLFFFSFLCLTVCLSVCLSVCSPLLLPLSICL